MNPAISLRIDTTDVETAHVSLCVGDKTYKMTSSSRVLKSQTVLPMIASLLSTHKLKLSDISAVFVALGPGSYTGVRVGVAVANMLSKLLNIPVNGEKKLATPKYS